MIILPGDLSQQFNELLTRKSFPDEAKSTYLKWLRFYWDFCDKYHYNSFCPESLPRFLQKLVEKRQSDQQLKQAGHAVTMFYRMQYQPAPFSGAAQAENSLQTAVHNEPTPLAAAPAETMATDDKPLKATNQGSSVYPYEIDITARTDTQTGSSWVLVYETLNSEIKIRHYSPKTLKSYRSWTRHFQAFTKSKNYQSLTQQDVVDFLSHLAVVKQVSVSSQNQAFNALLFLYKQVLKKQFGEIKGGRQSELLGHGDVRTTMIYTHTVQSRTLKQAKSPLDFLLKVHFECPK